MTLSCPSTSATTRSVASMSEVNHPKHYGDHPSGVECITVTEHMSFNLGNAIKYIWRSGLKGKEKQDLEKAIWYLKRELARLYPGQIEVPKKARKLAIGDTIVAPVTLNEYVVRDGDRYMSVSEWGSGWTYKDTGEPVE